MPLKGLSEYLDENYGASVFDEAVKSGESYVFHICGDKIARGKVTDDRRYEITLESDGEGGVSDCPKHDIKLVYPARMEDKVFPMVKIDKTVAKMGLAPTLQLSARNHVKNKTLYPLMMEREVLFFTLLGGETPKGLIQSFRNSVGSSQRVEII